MPSLPRLCLMLVTEPSPRLPEIVAEAVAGGVDIVQWRDKNAAPEAIFDAAWGVREVTRQRSLLVVNGWPLYSPSLVRKIGADGVHLPGNSPHSAEGVRRAIAGGLVGRSVHSLASAQQAQEEGADYLIAGTIFASQSHPEVEPAGLGFLRQVCAAVSVPVLAIGGVTPKNAGECLAAGAAGAAVLSPIMRAANPCGAARAYRQALDAAWKEIAPQPPILGEPEERR
ncbi:MAG: thiamine phosphate synthase [Armatimonadetes bacterium]|nr:thiamine phosphate synthase [Armatimonadota bacterium]